MWTAFAWLLQTLIKQIDLYGKLTGHQGCVNTVEFNSTGELLVSGSDDKQIMLWDWATQKLKFSYPSGHLDNIFQARIMPFTDDRKIVTSSADCQVIWPIDMHTSNESSITIDGALWIIYWCWKLLKVVSLGCITSTAGLSWKLLPESRVFI